MRDISYSRACKPDISCSRDEDSAKNVTNEGRTTALSELCSPLLREKLGSARESQCDDWPSEDFPAGEPSLTRTAQWTTYLRRFEHPQLLLPSREVFPHPLQSVFRAAHLFLCWIRPAGHRSNFEWREQRRVCAPRGPREDRKEVPRGVDGSKPRQQPDDDGPDDGQARQGRCYDGVRRHSLRERDVGKREESEEVGD